MNLSELYVPEAYLVEEKAEDNGIIIVHMQSQWLLGGNKITLYVACFCWF